MSQTRNEQNPERGWLIEHKDDMGTFVGITEWGAFEKTRDSLKAIRLAQKEDADNLIRLISNMYLRFDRNNLMATEHQWG